MKKQIFLIVLCCHLTMAYGAISGSEEDSTKTYNTADVVVTATRSEILPVDAPSPIQIISLETIREINGNSVADLLRTADGIDLKDYGVVGSVKNAKIRGLSTENMLFLINGNPINNAQYGSVDLGLLPPESIDRMEVSYGSSSALYGGNALGGVINIITRNASNDFHAATKMEGGSFNHRRISAELQGRVEGMGLLSGIVREYGNDYYPFLLHRQNNSDTILNRRNADYQRTYLFLNSDYRFKDSSAVNATVQYISFKRGDPGSINYPSIARLNDNNYRASLNGNIKLADDFLLRFGGIYNYNDELYYDSLDYTYDIKDYSFHAQIEWRLADWYRLLGGIEYNDARLKANGYVMQFDSLWNAIMVPFKMNPIRIQRSMLISNEFTVQRDDNFFDKISIFQSLRYDSYSDIEEEALSPKIGLNIRIYRPYDIRLRSSYGKNFRVPTFNDLYYPMYSNSNLTPEHANAFDVGIVSSLDRKRMHSIDLTYFDIISKDKIIYGAGYIPYNLGKAENSGYEVRYNYRSSDGTIEGYLGFTFIDAINKNQQSENDPAYGKQLPYVPKSIGTFGVSFETEVGRINLYHLITSLRYTDTQNSISLPAYELTSVNLENKLMFRDLQITMRCAVNNVFDVDYQVVEGYPMPGRSYKIGISMEY